MRVLLVEDEPRVAQFVRRGLREEQFTVDVAQDGEEALFMAETGEYDAMVLDLRLPKRDGIEVLTHLRAHQNKVPVLVLTAKDDLKDKVEALNKGADDYLVKPFKFEELLARLRALLRRQGELYPLVLRAGGLEMDTSKHSVTHAGQMVQLTTREYSVLEFLVRNQGKVVTRTMLSEHVWEHDFDSMSNVIDVLIARLRKKLGGDSGDGLIRTVRGSGYILEGTDEHVDRPGAP
ncbi:MAG: response regulator transcription factor [Candidatus Omnitrophica bacterium]|nr:response regulator transcription factor [Candidatus Omnitrophota bacterium]